MGFTSLVNGANLPSLDTSKPFHIEAAFHQRVQVDYSTTVSCPETKGGILNEYAPVPPDTETQKTVSCHISCREIPHLYERQVPDENDSTRFYKMIQVPMANTLINHPFHIDITYIIDLYDVKLGEGVKQSDVTTDQPTYLDTRATKSIDYQNPAFQSYLRDFGLIKTNGESNIAFAYRAFRILCADLATRCKNDAATVGSPPSSYLCQRTMHNGGCGYCASQYVAILRANGVPARMLAGRWAKNGEPNYGQWHVRTDFFDPTIGWLPVDASFGFSEYRDAKNFNEQFLNCNRGDFITMHLNTEVHPQGSNFEMPIQQFGVCKYDGAYPFRPQYTESWIVKKLDQSNSAQDHR